MEKIESFVQIQMKEHWKAIENMPVPKIVNLTNYKVGEITTDYISRLREKLLGKIQNSNLPKESKLNILKEFDQLFESIL